MTKSTVNIEGMTCGHCAETVTKVLNGLSGISEVSVSLEENLARVNYDDETISLLEITKAIEAAGFEVKGTG